MNFRRLKEFRKQIFDIFNIKLARRKIRKHNGVISRRVRFLIKFNSGFPHFGLINLKENENDNNISKIRYTLNIHILLVEERSFGDIIAVNNVIACGSLQIINERVDID